MPRPLPHPTDVPLAETLAFVRSRLPRRRARILEVGCGDGALATRLARLGHEVVALDADRREITRARRRGLDAVTADWPDFDAPPFDAILFTRSLHHIHRLDAAVQRARALLRPGGVVLAEEFAFSDIDATSAEWLAGILAPLHLLGRLRRPRRWHHFVGALLRADDALAAWRRAHDHDLHSAAAMEAALRREFPVVEVGTAPYLYRYVAEWLVPGRAGSAAAARILEAERRFIRAAELEFVGRRFVARLTVASTRALAEDVATTSGRLPRSRRP
jgi:2-polyprenyl-3-methyl-5-hydroxy-6-metoxy-1,4-benzoquinol methylase